MVICVLFHNILCHGIAILSPIGKISKEKYFCFVADFCKL